MFEVHSGRIEKHKKVVIYGPEGVGKSSLANNFPKPLFIDTEGSTVELDTDRLPRPSSWQMLKQQIDWYKGQIGRFETLIIDTLDWAEALCNQQICANHGVKGIEDIGYGKGYVFSTEEFGRLLNMLSDVIDMGSHVVLVAHSQIVKFEQPDEMGAYDRYQLKLGKGTGSRTAALVKEWADMVLFINYKTYSVATDKDGKKFKAQGGQRVVYATHHPAWDAKNRHGLPDEFPLDYSYIAHVIDNAPSINESSNNASVTEQPTTNVAAEPVLQAETIEQTQEQTPVVQEEVVPTRQVPQEPVELDPSIPQSLRDLMRQHDVTEVEIQHVVAGKGYYPFETPITNYDEGFIEGVLVGAWEQVYGEIENTRKEIPFENQNN